MALVQDELGNWYDDGSYDWYDYGSEPSADDSGFVDYSGYGDLTGPQLAQLAKDVESNTSGASFSDLLKQYGDKALDMLKTGGAYDPLKLAKLGVGLYAASRPNTPVLTGYQGKIPKYTASRNMLTAPPEGRRPGSGGINYGGGVTYRNPNGEIVSSNERPVLSAAKGGLVSDGFVVPADVVSHLGNGSSEAGLKLLASKFGAEPIKGEGDGMSDSIPTKIDGVQEARVANEEAFISPEMVERIGGGSSEKGAKKLYAMMDRIRKDRTGTTKQGKQIEPDKYMPGGFVDRYETGGTTTAKIPTGVTGTESSLSNWAGDYVTDMLGRGSALAQAPYEAYTGPLTAGPSALQQQGFSQVANFQTPSAISDAASTAGGIAASLAKSPAYSAASAPSYQQAVAKDVSSSFKAPDAYVTGTFTNAFKAPEIGGNATNFTNQFATPASYEAGQFDGGIFGTEQARQYMNPYLQVALEPQLQEARRQSDISRLADAARLTQAGAFGGSRQAIMEAEARRNLGTKLADITGAGYNTAYANAMAQFNADQNRSMTAQQAREQSRQFGAGQSMTAAQLQAQYNLSAQQAQEMARQFNQGQAMTAAQLQAQFGLSAQQAQEASRQFGAQQALASATTAGQQGLQAGIANQQAGLTASQANINAALEAAKMQEQSRQFGANLGLQSQQAGIQAALAQGNLGNIQSQSELAGINALLGAGAAERAIEAEGIAADKAQFEEARLNPYKMLQFEQSLLSGLPLGSQSYTQPGASDLQQFASGTQTAQQILDILSGKTPAAAAPK